MYYLITMINLFGAMYAMGMLIELARAYMIAPKMEWYIYFSIVSMLFLACTQIYYLTLPEHGDWILRLAGVLWWGPKVFLAWALKYSSLKK